MWYTLLHNETTIGTVDLEPGALVAAVMLRLPAYEALAPVTRAATAALLQLGLFGGAMPAIPPYTAGLLRRRHALTRAARLSLSLIDGEGAVARTRFVNLLEAPADGRIVVVAGFESSSPGVGAHTRNPQPTTHNPIAASPSAGSRS
jgi:hypothetical protein